MHGHDHAVLTKQPGRAPDGRVGDAVLAGQVALGGKTLTPAQVANLDARSDVLGDLFVKEAELGRLPWWDIGHAQNGRACLTCTDEAVANRSFHELSTPSTLPRV